MKNIIAQESDAPGKFSEHHRKVSREKRALEREIHNANKTIERLYDVCLEHPGSLDSSSRCEISRLAEELGRTVRDTLDTVTETIERVKQARHEIVEKLRDLNSGKAACNAYLRSGVL